MLEVFCDAHLHIARLAPTICPILPSMCALSTCALSYSEWSAQKKAADAMRTRGVVTVCTYGVHPLDAGCAKTRSIDTLAQLLRHGEVDAVGEAGYDLRIRGCRTDAHECARQDEIWHNQVDLSLQYGKPLVVHCVKALDKIMCCSTKLAKLPAVVFHSFGGSAQDAASILRHGVNAYFSFGAGLFNGSKRAIECARIVPQDRLLLETDAPCPMLPLAQGIRVVYQKASELLGQDMSELCNTIRSNFCAAYLTTHH